MVTYQCFKGVGDPIRHAIVSLLSQKSRNVTDLAARFDVSRPAISRHLRVMRESGLVTEVKSGREHAYSLAPATLEAAAEWLQSAARGCSDFVPTALPPPVADRTGWRQW